MGDETRRGEGQKQGEKAKRFWFGSDLAHPSPSPDGAGPRSQTKGRKSGFRGRKGKGRAEGVERHSSVLRSNVIWSVQKAQQQVLRVEEEEHGRKEGRKEKRGGRKGREGGREGGGDGIENPYTTTS
ncbi:hypothetical protein AXG93_2018s1020 [Marchantia polymorpha subsp. ruderalis]|uniref:Uncharacterized protein n=1 Tax=Marchantia polymorpha subsp. ruderalis TaxID=1480154 RepID=A0A176WCJ4_MARPO|nr:hypothetical protein AXG93_2018s1020 [Marchantia polymorpha subsp. ruderalis]